MICRQQWRRARFIERQQSLNQSSASRSPNNSSKSTELHGSIEGNSQIENWKQYFRNSNRRFSIRWDRPNNCWPKWRGCSHHHRSWTSKMVPFMLKCRYIGAVNSGHIPPNGPRNPWIRTLRWRWVSKIVLFRGEIACVHRASHRKSSMSSKIDSRLVWAVCVCTIPHQKDQKSMRLRHRC